MTAILTVPMVLLFVLFLSTLEAQTGTSPRSRGSVSDLCSVLNSAGEMRTIHALARLDGAGLLLIDMTCPVDERDGRVLATTIRVPRLVTDQQGDAETLILMRDTFERPLLQVVIRGRMHCKSVITVKADRDGHVFQGDGYGETGLIRCIVEGAHLVRMKRFWE